MIYSLVWPSSLTYSCLFAPMPLAGRYLTTGLVVCPIMPTQTPAEMAERCGQRVPATKELIIRFLKASTVE
jgi:hypothetical protein